MLFNRSIRRNRGNKVSKTDEYSYKNCMRAFLSAMEKKTVVLGMTDSVFKSVSGLSEDSKTTPRDLLKCLIEACSYNDILKIWNKKEMDVPVYGENARVIKNVKTSVSDGDLESEYYIFGGKTGHHKNHYALVMIGAKIDPNTKRVDDKNIIAGVVMNEGGAKKDRFTAMKELYDVAYAKIQNPDFTAQPNSVTKAQGAIACRLPLYNTAMYQKCELEILYEQNADGKPNVNSEEDARYVPASTTKIMTLITGLDYLTDLHERITIEEPDIRRGSGSKFIAGDIVSMDDIIAEMLLPSSNTCATAFAHHVGKIILERQAQL